MHLFRMTTVEAHIRTVSPQKADSCVKNEERNLKWATFIPLHTSVAALRCRDEVTCFEKFQLNSWVLHSPHFQGISDLTSTLKHTKAKSDGYVTEGLTAQIYRQTKILMVD